MSERSKPQSGKSKAQSQRSKQQSEKSKPTSRIERYEMYKDYKDEYKDGKAMFESTNKVQKKDRQTIGLPPEEVKAELEAEKKSRQEARAQSRKEKAKSKEKGEKSAKKKKGGGICCLCITKGCRDCLQRNQLVVVATFVLACAAGLLALGTLTPERVTFTRIPGVGLKVDVDVEVGLYFNTSGAKFNNTLVLFEGSEEVKSYAMMTVLLAGGNTAVTGCMIFLPWFRWLLGNIVAIAGVVSVIFSGMALSTWLITVRTFLITRRFELDSLTNGDLGYSYAFFATGSFLNMCGCITSFWSAHYHVPCPCCKSTPPKPPPAKLPPNIAALGEPPKPKQGKDGKDGKGETKEKMVLHKDKETGKVTKQKIDPKTGKPLKDVKK